MLSYVWRLVKDSRGHPSADYVFLCRALLQAIFYRDNMIRLEQPVLDSLHYCCRLWCSAFSDLALDTVAAAAASLDRTTLVRLLITRRAFGTFRQAHDGNFSTLEQQKTRRSYTHQDPEYDNNNKIWTNTNDFMIHKNNQNLQQNTNHSCPTDNVTGQPTCYAQFKDAKYQCSHNVAEIGQFFS